MEKRVVFRVRAWISMIAMASTLALGAAEARAATCTHTVAEFASFTTCTGTLADGAPYGIQIPDQWNGTLVLFCQSEGPAGTNTPPLAFVAPLHRRWFLEHGYAFAGSYSGTGRVVRAAIPHQIETLDTFSSMFGVPTRTIAWGGSMGGVIAAGLVQNHPERFSGALSMAGQLAGEVAQGNQGLDAGFVIQQLLGPESGLQIVHITDPPSNVAIALSVLAAAQATPQGRARIALASAVSDVPGWFELGSPEPPPDAWDEREENQYQWLTSELLANHVFGLERKNMETRSGGNPSWNIGVNYQQLLEKSINFDETVALYAAAGLSLEDDLARLRNAPRIVADPAAVQFLSEGICFNGHLDGVPVLTTHAIGDIGTVQQEFAYRSVVRQAGNQQLLRQAFINRPGHVGGTIAMQIAAFQALIKRIDAGKWMDFWRPESLNAAADALGALYNPGGVTPSFVDYEPAPFQRPYELGDPVPAAPSIPLVRGTKPDATRGAPQSEAPRLTARPSPYRGGSLVVSFAPDVGAASLRDIRVVIYDLAGRRISVLTPQLEGTASPTFRWDGRDGYGAVVRDGIYFLRASSDGPGAELKLVVMK